MEWCSDEYGRGEELFTYSIQMYLYCDHLHVFQQVWSVGQYIEQDGSFYPFHVHLQVVNDGVFQVQHF